MTTLKKVSIALLVFVVSACVAVNHPASQPDHKDIPRIAIATAFAPEFAVMQPRIENAQTVMRNGKTLVLGQLEGQDVVLFETGVSLVNAAMTTQLVIEMFEIKEIVVSGIAGGIDPNVRIGDVIIPDRWGQYNEMLYLRDEDLRDRSSPFGEPLSFEPFLFMAPRGTRVATEKDPTPERKFWYPVDDSLLSLAEQAAETVDFETCLEPVSVAENCLAHTPQAQIGGAGVSGSVFLDNADFRAYLHATFDADVAEMETAAVAMVAHANALPYIAFRSASDLAGGSVDSNEMQTFMSLAAENAARFVEAYLAEKSKAE